jgi:hypothetical protein
MSPIVDSISIQVAASIKERGHRLEIKLVMVLPTHVIRLYLNLFFFWGEINHLGFFGLSTGQEIGHNHKRPKPEVLEVQ